jgi:hypothetical protein
MPAAHMSRSRRSQSSDVKLEICSLIYEMNGLLISYLIINTILYKYFISKSKKIIKINDN